MCGQEIHYTPSLESSLVSVSLADFPRALTNATRFRVWQPRHGGMMEHTWALDNVFIGGTAETPNVLFDDFSPNTPAKDAWVDWPNGEVGKLCPGYANWTFD